MDELLQAARDQEAKDAVESNFEAAVEELMSEAEGHEDALIAVIEQSCGEDFILIGDNLDFLIKKTLSSKFNRNEMIHWFHLIGTLLCVPLCVCVCVCCVVCVLLVA